MSENTEFVPELTLNPDGFPSFEEALAATEAPAAAAAAAAPTLEEDNAVIKARAVAKATGYCALGDDSGLSVDALDGAPGVHSARYCGHHGDDKANNDLLIANLADVPAEDRTAEFVCALALSLPNGDVQTVRGTCPGVITFTPRGTGGFGYDPYFEYLSGETFAEMAQEEKNHISHRANAMQLMIPYLEEL